MNFIEMQRDICDTQLQKAACRLLDHHEMPLELVADRALTIAGVYLVIAHSKAEAADILRQAADCIEAGVYDKVTGTAQ